MPFLAHQGKRFPIISRTSGRLLEEFSNLFGLEKIQICFFRQNLLIFLLVTMERIACKKCQIPYRRKSIVAH